MPQPRHGHDATFQGLWATDERVSLDPYVFDFLSLGAEANERDLAGVDQASGCWSLSS